MNGEAQRVLDALRVAGVCLRAREIAERMGVSRGQVHRALITLRQEGFVELHPGSVYFLTEWHRPTTTVPTVSSPAWPACVDCGRPRHPHSGQRCAICYRNPKYLTFPLFMALTAAVRTAETYATILHELIEADDHCLAEIEDPSNEDVFIEAISENRSQLLEVARSLLVGTPEVWHWDVWPTEFSGQPVPQERTEYRRYLTVSRKPGAPPAPITA